MADDAYQQTAPIKAQAVAASQQAASDLAHVHGSFSRAVKHLNTQFDRPVAYGPDSPGAA